MILSSFPSGATALVIGSTGGIGSALHRNLIETRQFQSVIGLSRSTSPRLDLLDETTIADAAGAIAASGADLRLIIVATGMLHTETIAPEKSWRQLDAMRLAQTLAINATGPALVMKHFLPLLPRQGRSVFAALSAKVGSIGDNGLGGWYGYRAAKAALNQFLHTAAIELGRTRPDAVCLALHPGSVDTALSRPFASPSHPARSPDIAAADLLAVIDGAVPSQTGSFLDYTGATIPW